MSGLIPGISITPAQQQALLEAAQAVQKHAYAPYSHYHVGAALLTRDGKIYTGCNVENASYPAGICAERTAIVKAISEGEQDFIGVAVVTDTGGSPCGICRQVLSEFSKEMKVFIYKSDGTLIEATDMNALLPLSFDNSKLSVK
jgi:cytidine deaminase